MRQSTTRLCAGAAAAAVGAFVWVSAAVAAPGEKRCSMARGWVQDHCGSPTKVAASREGTPARCARARNWIDERCSGKHAYRNKVGDYRDDDAAGYVPRRHHKHAHKANTRVYAYGERPRRCCHSESAIYYRQPRYKDVVFTSDFVPRPGWEWAFYWAQERGGR